jgi:CheY-like chemotaxis protein
MACRGVVGDTGRIRQIVLNLLSNAIKFTEEGHVTLRVRGGEPDHGRAEFRIEVEDTGPGIPPDKVPLLFHNFTQLDSSLIRKHEGAGLGLAISRRLAELMGGSLTLTSRFGGGSTFLLTLPLNTFDDSDLSPAPPMQRVPAASDGRIRRVLLVEDNAVNQRLGVRALGKLGCSIDVAGNGLEAIEMALGRHYDLILMDCRMPEMDGYAATREIRSREEEGARVPIIALTAHAVTGAREECIAAGMDDFITKPLLPGDLEKVLMRWGGSTLDGNAKHVAGLKENTV